MFECLFGIILFTAGIVWLVQLISDDNLNSKIRRAQQSKNYREYARLSSERTRRDMNRRQAETQGISNNLWMDRIFVLDAAEHGVFVPGAERVFEDPGYSSYDDAQDDYEEDYEDDYDAEFVDETQQYDQYEREGWYPGDDFQPD